MSEAGAGDGPLEPAELRRRVAHGIAWKTGTQVVSQVTRVAVGLVLARLLTPQEFGLAGMALVVSGFVIIFTDLSLGATIVQRKTLSDADRSTFFWTALGIGVVCTAAGVGLSGAAADLFGQPRVAPLFAGLSVCFLLNSLSSTQSALLLRKMDYRGLQIREIGAALAAGAVAVGVAVSGGGAWAIIAQSVASSAASVVLLWTASPWRPQLVYSRESARAIASYGGTLSVSRLFSFLSLNGDNLLIGRFLGSTALGIYSLSYNLMFTPMQRLNGPIYDIAFPALARMQGEPARMREGWLRAKRIAATALAPAFVGMAVTAPDLVPVLFGSKWRAAIPVAALLSLGGLNNAVRALNWGFLSALGRATTVLRVSSCETVLNIGAFAIGLHWGVVGVAAGYAIAQSVQVLPDTWVAARAGSVPLRKAVSAALFPGVASAAAMGAVVYALRLLLAGAGVPAAPRLAICVLSGAVVYVGLVRAASPRTVDDIRSLVPRMRIKQVAVSS